MLLPVARVEVYVAHLLACKTYCVAVRFCSHSLYVTKLAPNDSRKGFGRIIRAVDEYE